MSRIESSNLKSRKIQAEKWCAQADKYWSRHRLKLAFPLFLAAAKAGNENAIRIVCYFYDQGWGVKRNDIAALYWYMRSHRLGNLTATSNIGYIWRDRHQMNRALAWFKRAVKLGDGDANLLIADIYLRQKADLKKVVYHLKETIKAKYCTQGSKEEAIHLLKRIKDHKAIPEKIFR